jgi:hypothetical protein
MEITTVGGATVTERSQLRPSLRGRPPSKLIVQKVFCSGNGLIKGSRRGLYLNRLDGVAFDVKDVTAHNAGAAACGSATSRRGERSRS